MKSDILENAVTLLANEIELYEFSLGDSSVFSRARIIFFEIFWYLRQYNKEDFAKE